MLLKVTDLEVQYGRVKGTQSASLSVDTGEIVALIGSNGAGKSSTLKAILGSVSYGHGEILWQGRSLKGTRPSEAVRLGISLSPEGRRVFPQLTVQENLLVGGITRSHAEVAQRLEEVLGYFPRLRERAKQLAGSLSGGEQQMLAIGRGLMSRPTLFLIDEPSLGLAPVITERIGEILLDIGKREGLAVILAEQNAVWALSIASRAVILELGRTTASGTAAELIEDSTVRQAYLGL